MIKPFTHFLIIVALSSFSITICKAQNATLKLKSPTAHVNIDGLSNEWTDGLDYYDEQSKVNYTLSNDKRNLYLVVKTKNPIQQVNILAGGLNFNVDPKNRQQNDNIFNTTYPFPASDATTVMKAGESIDEKRARVANLLGLKKIAIGGFKNDTSTGSSAKDIKVAINYDDDGGLVYEEAIPLSLFHERSLNGEWAFYIILRGAVFGDPSKTARTHRGKN